MDPNRASDCAACPHFVALPNPDIIHLPLVAMASVSSLDKDLRQMRLDKYTPAAANEARKWIEETLGERLPSSDLLEGLKDGVALCKYVARPPARKTLPLVNRAVPPPGVKFKQSAMPFVQMENISHFLRACQAPPLNLQQHDMFLTVDLFEQKDPAQVLQCLGAFSRAANAANPRSFPTAIGPKTRGVVSPQGTGPAPATPTALRDRGTSITSNTSSAYGSKPVLPHRTGDSASGRWSPTKGHGKTPSTGGSPGTVSTWSKREQEGATSPAWNIAQYGYMGGASQGNLGIAFGGRRQITNAAPQVPSLADKERRRKEEEERQRQEAEEEERRRQAEEEEAKREEERRWEAETERLREEERRKAEDEKRQWAEQERQWQLAEQKRLKEEREAEYRLQEERRRARSQSDNKLRGQFLSQYQAEQADAENSHSSRIKELEKELELARQREAEYERERQGRVTRADRPANEITPPKPRSRSRHAATASPPAAKGPEREPARFESWSKDEREVLQTAWNQHQERLDEEEATPDVPSPLVTSRRPLPDPTAVPKVKSPSGGSRPLPDPSKYTSPTPPTQSRTDRFLSSNAAPTPTATPQTTYARELGATEERDGEDRRRAQAQAKTKAGGWASKSLLEREMEMERERQREWEEAQRETARAARPADGAVDGIGGGVGGRWDVGQWSGYTGGDSQNRGGQGIGAGRRQIVGPRPLPGAGR
ncbi:rRNA-processing protein EFG1 [Purpureocillium lavendulum]|uniref:rRNA-processing protein EFG1 n=1 Tax=Purpureocillium lavendulum TaxID=1247861 RepID=A0AB34G668_9HYPO|nr:rRNA-processing protein EFG1 [Purpureocillium lavendulum]